VEKWGVRGSNFGPCIYYAISISNELNSWQFFILYFIFQFGVKRKCRLRKRKEKIVERKGFEREILRGVHFSSS